VRRTLSTAETSVDALRDQLLDLLWSLWSEMGVPGWARRHQAWAIDPEPLIVFTALLGASDPRLRDESIRWCLRNAHYVSALRLRNLLQTASPAVLRSWGPYAATVNAHTRAEWPHATTAL